MVQMNQAIARLRLVLAEISARESQTDNLIRQFRTQLRRLPRQAIYGRTPLDLSLSAMGEIDERLNHALATRSHLEAIKKQAEEELKALQITTQVEEAKQALQDLRHRSALGEVMGEEDTREVKRLEEFIAEYSRVAEKAITDMVQENRL